MRHVHELMRKGGGGGGRERRERERPARDKTGEIGIMSQRTGGGTRDKRRPRAERQNIILQVVMKKTRKKSCGGKIGKSNARYMV